MNTTVRYGADGVQRVVQVDLVQGIFTISFFVTQTGTGIITADNTTITADNATITADNG